LRQTLADLMAIAIFLSVMVLIFGADDVSVRQKQNNFPEDFNAFSKTPIARIEFTIEDLLRLMGLSEDQSNPVSA